MAVNIPVPQLLDVEKITLSVMPRLFNGHVSPNATIVWTSSDPTQGEAIPGTDPFVFHDSQFNEDVTVPGSYNCTATTPNTTGSYTVDCTGSDAEGTFDPVNFGPINYVPGVARSLNASVGSPVSDL